MIEKDFRWRDIPRAFWFFLEGQRVAFVFWFTVLCLVFFYALIPPILISKTIDFFIGYHPGDSMRPFYIIILIFGASHGIVALIRLTAKNRWARLDAQAEYAARVKGFERLTEYSLRWHDQENTGNKVQRIQTGIESLSDIRKLMSKDGFKTFVSIVGVLIVFVFLNPIFVAFFAVYLGVFFLINASFQRIAYRLQQQYNQAKEKASGTYYEGLNNLLTVKSLGVKDGMRKSVESKEAQSREFKIRLKTIGTNKWKIFQIFNAMSMFAFLLLVGLDVQKGLITVGAIFIYYSYLTKLVEGAGDLTDMIERFTEFKSGLARMMPIYWTQEEGWKGTRSFPSHWKEFCINQAAFRYKMEDDLPFSIHDLSLSIRQNEKIGIAGASGSGKSTLAKLLLGLYNLEQGSITFDKTDFYSIKHDAITRTIAIVLQDAEMFNMTLRENITLLRPSNANQLKEAIEIAQLEELVKKLPQGLDTLIGEKGYRLSGGERQRIGLARALYKDPQILILDEATSSLDSRTEDAIQSRLEKNLKKKTIITIAHRVSTLKNCDRIYVFDEGTIVEQGTYDALMKNSRSKFAQLYQTQQKIISPERA